MMNKSSALKISAALFILSLYICLFGFMGVIEPTRVPDSFIMPETPSEEESGADAVNNNAGNDDVIVHIDSENGRKPTLADYSSPFMPPPVTTSAPNAGANDTAAPDGTSLYTDEEESDDSGDSGSGDTVTTPVSDDDLGFSDPDETTAPPASTAPPATTSEPVASEPPLPPGNETPPPVTGENLSVMSNGTRIEGNAADIVAKVVQSEIGSAFHKEAIKAQAVATFTYIKRLNALGNTPSVVMAATASYKVTECVNEVIGQGIYYNNSLIQAVYCASTAGYSASSGSVWTEQLPYLKSVKCEFDETYDPNYGQTKTFTSNELMIKILDKTGIELSGDPAGWFKILSRVDTVYIGELSIGGRTTYVSGGEEIKITGRVFREKIMSYDLRSAAFEIDYNAARDMFTFTTYGYGHGAGMSQNGAHILATHYGYNYIDILKYYYADVEVK